MAAVIPLAGLRAAFGGKVQANVPLAKYTAARVGGPAEVLLVVRSAAELEQAVIALWELDAPFRVLGGGSNVLVSDAGVKGVVLLNQAKGVRFTEEGVSAESGANLGSLARQAAGLGLSGLEWAAGIPGTIGGAVVGNAGAHDGDMAGTLMMASILHHSGVEKSSGSVSWVKEIWTVERMEYSYRSSILKRKPGPVVLSADLRLKRSTPEAVQAKVDLHTQHRRKTQPPGASMGSMFKNPPGDYAGRLIEAAGLKGTRVGEAQISELHANFFINLGEARASDIVGLMKIAKRKVKDQFGVVLEPEIELLGEWDEERI